MASVPALERGEAAAATTPYVAHVASTSPSHGACGFFVLSHPATQARPPSPPGGPPRRARPLRPLPPACAPPATSPPTSPGYLSTDLGLGYLTTDIGDVEAQEARSPRGAKSQARSSRSSPPSLTYTQKGAKKQSRRGCSVALGNVMAHPRRQQRRSAHGGGLRLLAVLLVVLSLRLARLDAVAASSAASPEWKQGAATALEKVVGQEAARGLTAAPEEEGGPAVTERVEMEVIDDYPQTGANNRHNPHP